MTRRPDTPDLEFRPLHYSDFPDPLSAVLSGIHGSRRRDMVRDVLGSEGQAAEQVRELVGDLQPGLLETKAPPGFVGWMTRLDPRWVGGENLPPDEPGEIEIARMTLDTRRREVIAVRARWDASRAEYRYRIVDDHTDRDYTPVPGASDEPFSLRQLLRFLDRSTLGTDGTTLSDEIQRLWETGYIRRHTLQRAARYVAVTSELYPDLQRAMELRWERWLGTREEDPGQGAA